MDRDLERLLATASELQALGEEVEASRERLRELVAAGVSYDAGQMKDALSDFLQLDEQWNALERDYLILRDRLKQK